MMQLAIDRWAINATLPPGSLDSGALLDLFVAELSLLGIPVNASRTSLAALMQADPATYAALISQVTDWLDTPEPYAPQSVDFLPFPFFKYTSRPFYNLLIPLFAFFFLFTVSCLTG